MSVKGGVALFERMKQSGTRLYLAFAEVVAPIGRLLRVIHPPVESDHQAVQVGTHPQNLEEEFHLKFGGFHRASVIQTGRDNHEKNMISNRINLGPNGDKSLGETAEALRGDGARVHGSQAKETPDSGQVPAASPSRPESEQANIADVESGRSSVENEASPSAQNIYGELQGNGAAGDPPTISYRGTVHETPAASHSPGTMPGDWRIEEANRRQGILQTFWACLEHGVSRMQAAREVGEPFTNIWRYEKAYRANGYEGLIPDISTGRKTVLQKLGFSPEQIKTLLDQVQGLNLDTESTTTALRLFASSDRCPEELAQVILDPNRCSKHAIPQSIRRAATPTKNSRLAHRGPRALDLGGIWIPRKLDILPGDIFCPDDTTPIFGWWVPWIASEEYPFGVKLLQGQLLRIIDVASQCPVGRVLIAREKSSYRASDIWCWVGFIADDIGLPRLGLQTERGSWDANILQGVEVTVQDGDVSHGRRVGGLRQLPANVTAWHREHIAEHLLPKSLQTWTSYLPKSKSIEAYFDRVQTLEGTLYGSLGRDQMRRPFEKAKKLFQQCSRQNAKIDPRDHFLSGMELMSRLNAMDEFLANEPMEGEVFKGIPRVNFETAIRQHPLFQLPEESRWLYRRDWKRLTITQGWARVRLTDPISGERYSIHYVNPRVFAEIEGREVVVYYDREKFEEPAQIVAASRFSAAGREFYPGDYVCEAEHFERPGMFLDTERSGHDVRKLWKNAVMTIYGRSSVHAPSRNVPREIADRRLEKGNSFNLEGPTPFAKPGAAAATAVDGRPAAQPSTRKPAAERAAGVTDDEFELQAKRLARDEERARHRQSPTILVED